MYNLVKNLLSLVFFVPFFIYGQVDLCHNCAAIIYDPINSKGCCEVCLQEFYVQQLRKDITHGLLSNYYKCDVLFSFMQFPDTLSAQFLVLDIRHKDGYRLQDSSLIAANYYLIHLKCKDTIIPQETSIILIVDDSTPFDIGQCYHLKMHSYFKRNQSFRVIEGELRPVIGGAQTVFDLVYKKWLIPFLSMGQNYFFLHSETKP